jgi:hypothetical protein
VMSRREYLVKPVPAAVSSAPKKPAPKK